MSIRRPRIKAAANLMSVKRKLKPTVDTNSEPDINNYDIEKSSNKFVDYNKQTNSSSCEKVEKPHRNLTASIIAEQEQFNISQGLKAVNNSETIQSHTSANLKNVCELIPEDDNSFKCPSRIESNSNCTTTNVDEIFHTQLESDVIKKDLLKSAMYPMSPTKTQSRQRIRATPVFGQRRNSFVSTSPSPYTNEETLGVVEPAITTQTQRRERHVSATFSQTSAVQHYNNVHKMPMGAGDDAVGGERLRTQSICSALSESVSKARKSEDTINTRSRRDFEARFTNGVPDKSSIKMFDLIYYNPATNPMEQISHTAGYSCGKLYEVPNANVKERFEKSKTNPKNIEEIDSSNVIAVPQLKLNASGELILDDKSLEIETTAEQEARKVLANSSLIYLDENTGMNGFYKRQKRTKEWLPVETIKFYRCLQTVGTDFSLMCQLFPNRTRRDLKLKFKKEERCNIQLINKALLYPKIFNIEDLKEQLEVEQQEKQVAERKWKRAKSKMAKHIKKIHCLPSAAARNLTHGDDIYQSENVVEHRLSENIATVHEPNNATDASLESKTVRWQGPQKLMSKVDTSGSVHVNLAVKKEGFEAVKLSLQSGDFHANATAGSSDYTENTQIEKDLTELLRTENLESPQIYDRTVSDQFYKQNLNVPPAINDLRATIENNMSSNKTFINLDDGTVTLVSQTTESSSDDTFPSSLSSEHDLNERDIQTILSDLAQGSLVLVSTLNPENPDKVLNEIYMMDKITGELFDKPLDIPEVIVQAILSVLT